MMQLKRLMSRMNGPRAREPQEQCEFCSLPLASRHQHLLGLKTHKLACVCDACAILFPGQEGAAYRLIPREVFRLREFRMTDLEWEDLRIPINLAFIFHSTAANRPVAMYPSPAGATESLLALDSWQDLVARNPVLGQLTPDVEALLVYRVREHREHYRVPIDECYRLVGLIRMHWHGLWGGTEVWQEIDQFFADLERRAQPVAQEAACST